MLQDTFVITILLNLCSIFNRVDFNAIRAHLIKEYCQNGRTLKNHDKKSVAFNVVHVILSPVFAFFEVGRIQFGAHCL